IRALRVACGEARRVRASLRRHRRYRARRGVRRRAEARRAAARARTRTRHRRVDRPARLEPVAHSLAPTLSDGAGAVGAAIARLAGRAARRWRIRKYGLTPPAA